MNLHYKPTAAELVAAVAEFLETEVRDGTSGGAVNFHARVAANVLRTVERELLDDSAEIPRRLWTHWVSPTNPPWRRPSAPGASGDEVLPALHALVRHRLAVAHPGYERE